MQYNILPRGHFFHTFLEGGDLLEKGLIGERVLKEREGAIFFNMQ